MANKGVNLPLKASYQAASAFRKMQDDLRRTKRGVSEASAHVKAYRDEMTRLTNRFNPVAAAAARAESEIQDLNRAYRMGIVDLKQYETQLRNLSRTTNLGSFANKRFSESLGGSTWRRQVQQAGMQVSDFAVQVAGGQSAILAFTQNAPQFLQNFNAVGSVLAAVVTILGTVAFSYSKTLGALKSFEDGLNDAEVSIKSYIRLSEALRKTNVDLGNGFEEAGSQIKSAMRVLSELKLQEAQDTLDKMNESIVGLTSTRGGGERRAEMADMFDLNIFLAFTDKQREARKEARLLTAQYLTLSDQLVASAGNADAQFDALSKMLPLAERMADFSGSRNDAEKELLQNIANTLKITGELTTKRASLADSDERNRKAHAEYARSRNVSEMITTRELSKQVELNRKAHVQYARSRNVSEMITTRELLKQVELNRKAHVQYARSRDVASRLAQNLGNSVDELMKMSGIDITSPIASATREAAQLAVNLGTSLNAALSIKNLQSGKKYGGRGGGSEYHGQSDYQNEMGYTTIDQVIKDWKRVNVPNARGGSGGKSEIQKEREELKKLVDDVHPALQKRLRETKSLTMDVAREIQSSFEQTQKAISQSMMSAFKGLLDGSKSFGEAARDILGSIMNRVIDLLMTPIFDGLAGSLAGSIMGGLTNVGASFDGGGFTGAGVRAGGLDGKGGKLAMVHPNETVVDHTKGQTLGGNTVVFNIQTPDVEGFKRSQRQLARQAKAALG